MGWTTHWRQQIQADGVATRLHPIADRDGPVSFGGARSAIRALKFTRVVNSVQGRRVSPELNPVERLWCWLKEHYLSNRIYADYDALLDAGSKAWNCLTPELLQSVCRTAWLERMD